MDEELAEPLIMFRHRGWSCLVFAYDNAFCCHVVDSILVAPLPADEHPVCFDLGSPGAAVDAAIHLVNEFVDMDMSDLDEEM